LIRREDPINKKNNTSQEGGKKSWEAILRRGSKKFGLLSWNMVKD